MGVSDGGGKHSHQACLSADGLQLVRRRRPRQHPLALRKGCEGAARGHNPTAKAALQHHIRLGSLAQCRSRLPPSVLLDEDRLAMKGPHCCRVCDENHHTRFRELWCDLQPHRARASTWWRNGALYYKMVPSSWSEALGSHRIHRVRRGEFAVLRRSTHAPPWQSLAIRQAVLDRRKHVTTSAGVARHGWLLGGCVL